MPLKELTIKTHELSDLEKKIIEDIVARKNTGYIERGNAYPTVAYAVYLDSAKMLQFGRVRWGYQQNYHTNEGKKSDSLSISPFPSIWEMVPTYRIISIRHWRAV